MVHCAEVGRNNQLIDCIADGVVARLRAAQAELVATFCARPDEFGSIRGGTGLLVVGGVQQTDKDHGALGEFVLKKYIFAVGIFPRNLGFFDEENLIFIPAGDFDAAGAGDGEIVQNIHECLHREKSSCAAKQGLKNKSL
jgi:hypothetical protein